MTRQSNQAAPAGRWSAGIRRRDFINGVLVSAGGAAMSRLLPGCGSSDSMPPKPPPPPGLCDGGIGGDARALRGGNLPSAFNPGHFMRDGRLKFSESSVTVSPLSCDAVSGTLPISDDPGAYEVIIVGAGMSALSAAFFVTKMRPGTKILMLDANPVFGGNASRDDAAPIPAISSTAAAYAVSPYAPFLTTIYGDIGIDWAANYVLDPGTSYFFDDRTPHVLPGTRGWNIDTYGKGLKTVPYDPAVVMDLQNAAKDFGTWYNTVGAPTDPADDADPQYDYLAVMTLDDYLIKTKGFHPAVSDFYTRYTCDALTGTTQQVNAFSSISFLGAEYNPVFTFPGGNSGIARHVLKWLIPGCIAGMTSAEIITNALVATELDNEKNAVRVRNGAVVVRADQSASGASVVYFSNGKFFRAQGKAVILAGQGYTAKHIVGHLLDAAALDAFNQVVQVPALVANVSLKSAAPLLNLGLGYDAYFWGSKYWADFVVSDWVGADRLNPNRPTVLTFYGFNTAPPEAVSAERVKLLTTPFSDYEESLREDLSRLFMGANFDYDRDVSDVYIYRWGHSMVYPKPGMPFGPPQMVNGMPVRTPAPRHAMRKQIGRISIAGQDTESTSAIESAIGSGVRTANEVLTVL